MRERLSFLYRSVPNIGDDVEIKTEKFYKELMIKDKKGNNCMTLKLYEKEKIMIIVSLKYSENKNELQCETSGSELLNRAKMFVQNNVVHKLLVNDDSYIPHADVFKRISLKKVKTFITGKSWYEDHGFSYTDTERANEARELMETLKDSKKFLNRALQLQVNSQDNTQRERLEAYTSLYFTIHRKDDGHFTAKPTGRIFDPHTLNLLFGTTSITSLKGLDNDKLKILDDVLSSLQPSLPIQLEFSKPESTQPNSTNANY